MGPLRRACGKNPKRCKTSSTACRSPPAVSRRLTAPRFAAPEKLTVTIQPEMSTQTGFGALLNELAREKSELVDRIVTTSPDVTVSTNLGAWVNRRGLFAREALADTFRSERIPSTFNWDFSAKGQHIELGIAENNLFILLSALGLSHAINGERLIPIGTLYDPFIARGFDALNYACYQDARFILVATPSGVTLAPEGGAHQSIAEPLIGMAQDGLAAFEPAFVDELAVILAFALDYIQKDAGDRRRSLRAQLAARRNRRLDLSAAVDAADRADQAADDGGRCAKPSSTAPIGCVRPDRIAKWSSPIPGRSRPRRSRLPASWRKTAATSVCSP